MSRHDDDGIDGRPWRNPDERGGCAPAPAPLDEATGGLYDTLEKDEVDSGCDVVEPEPEKRESGESDDENDDDADERRAWRSTLCRSGVVVVGLRPGECGVGGSGRGGSEGGGEYDR